MYLLLFSKLLCLSAESGKQIWLGREQWGALKADLAHGFSHKSNFSTSKTMFYKLRLTLQSPGNHQGDAKCQAWLKAGEALQHCRREQGCATPAAWEQGKLHPLLRNGTQHTLPSARNDQEGQGAVHGFPTAARGSAVGFRCKVWSANSSISYENSKIFSVYWHSQSK